MTLAAGRRLRDKGQAQAAAAEGPWNDRADRALRDLAATGLDFTADDLVARVGMPEHWNAVGARLSAARRRGWITRVGQRQGAARAEQHARLVSVWRGDPRAAQAATVPRPPAQPAPDYRALPFAGACFRCHDMLTTDQLAHVAVGDRIYRAHRDPCYSDEVPT